MRKQSDGVHSSSQLITVIDTSATGWKKEILSMHCIKPGGFIQCLAEVSLFEGIAKILLYLDGLFFFLRKGTNFIWVMIVSLEVIIYNRWCFLVTLWASLSFYLAYISEANKSYCSSYVSPTHLQPFSHPLLKINFATGSVSMKMYNLNLKGKLKEVFLNSSLFQGPSANINSDWANKQRKISQRFC